MLTRRIAILLTGALAALSFAGPAAAQGKYPDQPVKLIVALPAGGSVDMIARTLGQKLSTTMGQPFVVNNRAGASGQIGMPFVAKSAADGYTLTVSPASFLTTNKSVFKSLPYDPRPTSSRFRAWSTSPWSWWSKTSRSTPPWRR